MDLTALDQKREAATLAAAGQLPPRLRVLFVTGDQRTGGWLAESLVSAGDSDVLLEEAVGTAAGLSRLRDEVFDIVLASHDAEDLDALTLLAGLRAGGSDEPVVVLGAPHEDQLLSQFCDAGADAYLAISTATPRLLLRTVARAVERARLSRENRRLVEAEQQREAQEHDEAERLLARQRMLLSNLEATAASSVDVPTAVTHAELASSIGRSLPGELVDHYRGLLRAYVIMGSGNMADEMSELVNLLATAGITAQQAMGMHLSVLEELVGTLGSRSARHVIARADLLLLEIMVRLAEGYRQRLECHVHPPRQLPLPGFDSGAKARAA